MSFQERIKKYSRPADPEWWDGRSNKEAISRWSERAHRESDGAAHRALSGEVRLPETGDVHLHATAAHRRGDGNDARAKAKADLNHRLDYDYLKKVRRI
jgi:hypothetical protein